MIQSRFSLNRSAEVDQFATEAIAWLSTQGFTGVKDRSHRGQAGTWVVKFHNQAPSQADPTKLIMNYRGWFIVKPDKVELLIERVPAAKVDYVSAPPDSAVVINHNVVIPFTGLDSLTPFKKEIEKWL